MNSLWVKESRGFLWKNSQPLEASWEVSLLSPEDPSTVEINTELLGPCCPCGDRNCSLFTQLHLVQLNSCCAWMDWRKSNWKHLEQSKGLPFFWNWFKNKPRWYPQQQRWYESMLAASEHLWSFNPTIPQNPHRNQTNEDACTVHTFCAESFHHKKWGANFTVDWKRNTRVAWNYPSKLEDERILCRS